jgi:NADH:ubiquinone oxidoreductase subunit H
VDHVLIRLCQSFPPLRRDPSMNVGWNMLIALGIAPILVNAAVFAFAEACTVEAK